MTVVTGSLGWTLDDVTNGRYGLMVRGRIREAILASVGKRRGWVYCRGGTFRWALNIERIAFVTRSFEDHGRWGPVGSGQRDSVVCHEPCEVERYQGMREGQCDDWENDSRSECAFEVRTASNVGCLKREKGNVPGSVP